MVRSPLRGGRVLDPALGLDAALDVAIAGGRIAAVEPSIPARGARRVLDVRDRLVIPGMIDTHAHVYEHVTGSFGLNPDLVGVRAGVTTVVDRAGPSPSWDFAFIADPRRRGCSPSSPTTWWAAWWAIATRRSTGRTASTCARR
jgi:dihydroorotase